MEPCCQDEKNLGEPQETDREGLVVRVCVACGRRHFELNVEPAKIGVTLRG